MMHIGWRLWIGGHLPHALVLVVGLLLVVGILCVLAAVVGGKVGGR